MRVYGWVGARTEAAGQTREIIAARSLAEAAHLSGTRRYFLTQYGGVTANPREVATALARPGVVFWRPLNERDAEYVADEKEASR